MKNYNVSICKNMYIILLVLYCIVGKFDGRKFGESSAIHKIKLSKLVPTINNLWLPKSFAKIFIHPLSPNIIAAKFSHCTGIPW